MSSQFVCFVLHSSYSHNNDKTYVSSSSFFSVVVVVVVVAIIYYRNSLTDALGQTDNKHGLKVDSCLRVEGVPDGSVVYTRLAMQLLADGFPPTAQVAQQDGNHIGRAFRQGVEGIPDGSVLYTRLALLRRSWTAGRPQPRLLSKTGSTSVEPIEQGIII